MKIELSLQPELDPEGCGGAENHDFFDVFLEPCFEKDLGAHFDDFGSLLGSPLETILVTFWVPFLAIWGPFGPYFGDLLGYVFGRFGSLLGALWETILVTFGVQF